MKIRRIFITAKNAEKIWRKHRVTYEEVREVVEYRTPHVRKARGQNRYEAYGQTDAGRYLFTILETHGHELFEVITAMEMTDYQRRYYQKRRKAT